MITVCYEGSNIQLYNWMSESQKFSTFRERASFSHFFSLANDSFAIDHRTLTLNITKVKTHRLNWLNWLIDFSISLSVSVSKVVLIL